jgi:low affinity Fe/Cu permease
MTDKSVTEPADLADPKSVAGHGWQHWFSWFARETAHFAGSPATFLGAVLLIIAWAATGPLFGYSDSWQLVINTGTTIITFLMVFLIQNTQNRDSLAVQIKLAELIVAMKGAENRLANAEELSDEELEKLHEQYRTCASTALDHLNKRRSALATRHNDEPNQDEPSRQEPGEDEPHQDEKPKSARRHRERRPKVRQAAERES